MGKVQSIENQTVLWLVLTGRVMTCENCNTIVWQGPGLCVLYQNHEESTSHLFISCDITKEVWRNVKGFLNCLVVWDGDSVEKTYFHG